MCALCIRFLAVYGSSPHTVPRCVRVPQPCLLPPHCEPPSLFPSSPPFFQQVGKWLASISLPAYVSVFHLNHVSGNILLKLDRESLRELVPSVGHRILLLEALATLLRTCGPPLGPPAAAAYLRKPHPHLNNRNIIPISLFFFFFFSSCCKRGSRPKFRRSAVLSPLTAATSF